MTCATITRVFSEAARLAIPEASLTVREWADAYRYLSPERSARHGKFRTEVVPHLRVPMELVSRPDLRAMSLWKASQVAGTTFVENVIGYYIHHDPSPILYCAEDESKATAWFVESFRPTVRDTPVLAALIGDPRSRDAQNTINHGVGFPGGHLALGWSTSPATASSRPRRVVILDELDAFARTKEGDYGKLAEARARTFPNKKIFRVSSARNRVPPPPGSPPDAVAMSPIERAYYESRFRGRIHVPCPHCGEYQELKWRDESGPRIRWDDGDRINAYFVCCHCGAVIEHGEKKAMLDACRWVFEGPGGKLYQEDELEDVELDSVGLFIWEGYSPFTSWGEIAADQPPRHEVERLKVWLNTRLAEPWDELQEQAEVSDLVARRDDYVINGEDGPLVVAPAGVLVVTAAADVQGDRLETELVGWGVDGESWSLGYHVIEGAPSRRDVWDELKRVWLEPIPRADGVELKVAAAAVDTGGHHSEEGYQFCRENGRRKWRAIKGASAPGRPLVSKPSFLRKPGGMVRLYLVGTETAKDTLAARLLVEEPGPGYCHFPSEHERDGRVYYDVKYFEQLRSERPVTRAGVRRWEKIRAGARNEALDLKVYNMAALALLNPNWRALAKRAQASTPAPLVQRARPCANPECDRDFDGVDDFCCPQCRHAREHGYEIHEGGPLGHGEACELREGHLTAAGEDIVRAFQSVIDAAAETAADAEEVQAPAPEEREEGRRPKKRKRRRPGGWATRW